MPYTCLCFIDNQCVDNEGNTHVEGDSYIGLDGCNQCTCTPEGSACTRKACIPTPGKHWLLYDKPHLCFVLSTLRYCVIHKYAPCYNPNAQVSNVLIKSTPEMHDTRVYLLSPYHGLGEEHIFGICEPTPVV